MARKRGKRPSGIRKLSAETLAAAQQPAPTESASGGSYLFGLLALGAAALIGVPMLRDATSEPVSRNHYSDKASCECDYGNRCESSGLGWAGPWYADAPGDRKAGDPGDGACYRQHRLDSFSPRYFTSGFSGSGGYSSPWQERGLRGGFGGTAHVRSAAS